MSLGSVLRWNPRLLGRGFGRKSFSKAAKNSEYADEFLPFPRRQVFQDKSFGETISFNLYNVWSQLPNLEISKSTTLGDIWRVYYLEYKHSKIYFIAMFSLLSFWMFNARKKTVQEKVDERLEILEREKLEKGEQ